MIIRKLVLHNFGIYAGTNEFTFDGDKNVVLIGGMNGRGKTTILEAVLLALYGRNSFAYTESKFQSYSRYLDSYVNKSDKTCLSYVTLNFEMDGSSYIVKRSWEGNKRKINDNTEVWQDGKPNEFLTENWVMFMENLLPSGLSNFFFFDGEKIAELAADSTDEKLKDSIKSLLGIEVLESLDRNLSKLLRKSGKEKDRVFKEEVSFELKRAKEDAEQQLRDLDDRIQRLEDELVVADKKIEQTRIEYTSKGGDIFEKKEEYYKKRSELAVKQSQQKEKLLDTAASELPLVLVRDLLEDVKSSVEKERESRENSVALKKIKEFYSSYKDNNNSDELVDFIQYMTDITNKSDNDMIYNMSDSSWLQLVQLCEGRLDKRIADTNHLFEVRDETQQEIESTDSLLSVEIDEEKIGKIYKKIIKLEHDKSKKEVDLEECRRERPHYNNAQIKATTEFNRYVEGMLKKLETSDDYDRIVKYSHLATSVLSEYKVKLQEKKIGKLADAMTQCYKQLANKKGMIVRIEMDPVSLDLKYLNDKKEEIPKERLSAGEKQLMVVSLLWALAICSSRKLPVIIDTPLSRLDSKHRMALIKTYFPNASDQTIVLSTDSEIYGKYYNALKKNVGNEYTLDYNDETRSTTILPGYRWEEEQ